MAYDVVMPQLGMTMEEGSVLRWFKQPGDAVEKGEPLFEVQTDKVDMEVEAQSSGFLAEILLEPGRTVPVGAVIARISGGQQQEPIPAGPDSGMVQEPAGAMTRKLSSPRARRVAADFGVDIALVEGTGEGGRIREADVIRYAQAAKESAPAPAVPVPALSPARKTVAAKMAQSFSEVPHFYLAVQADATSLKKVREDLLPVIEREYGVRLTYNDLLIKALALALEANPKVNVSWSGSGIVPNTDVHIGFAAQIGEALLVPVIRKAGRLSVGEIAKMRSDLLAKGQAGRLALPDLEGASCTLSNLGPFGVDQFQAIINPPQSAILAVGRIAGRPVAAGDEVVARPTVWLTLSVDHRVVDGVAAAEFLRTIVEAVQAPYRLLLERGIRKGNAAAR